MEALDGADQDRHGKRMENTRLRREIEALAMREASLRSLQETMAEVKQSNGARALTALCTRWD
jgi:hypothetical protein